MFQKTLSTIAAASMFAASIAPIASAQQQTTFTPIVDTTCNEIFQDVKMTNRFCYFIEYLYHQNVMVGSNKNFMPDSDITRQEVAAIVRKGFDITADTSKTSQFGDVDAQNKFYNDILVLKQTGISTGFANGTEYRPGNNISRGEIITLIIKAAKYKNSQLFQTNQEIIAAKGDPKIYFDDTADSKFAEQAGLAGIFGIAKGSPQANETVYFFPGRNITRAEAARMLSATMLYARSGKVACEKTYCQDKYTGTVPTIGDGGVAAWEEFTSTKLGIKFRYPATMKPTEMTDDTGHTEIRFSDNPTATNYAYSITSDPLGYNMSVQQGIKTGTTKIMGQDVDTYTMRQGEGSHNDAISYYVKSAKVNDKLYVDVYLAEASMVYVNGEHGTNINDKFATYAPTAPSKYTEQTMWLILQSVQTI